MIGLALGVAVLIVVLSVMNGFEEELRTRILSLTGHATISGLEGRIPNWRPQIAKLAHFPGVVAAAPYIEEQGMVTHGNKSAGILLRGVLPDAERKVADLGGIKSLYSDSYYTRSEFWSIFDADSYAALKAKYDPSGALGDLYDKCVLRR